MAADAVLAVGQQPKCGHPLVQSKRRVLKDRLDLQCELLLAAITEPQLTSLNERVLFDSAPWADDMAIWPAQFHREIEGPLRITEVDDGFLKCLGSVNIKMISQEHMCVN